MKGRYIQDDGRDGRLRISTGFPSLDRTLGGGLTNTLYIVKAEPDIGASEFLTFLAQNIAGAGTDVLYFAPGMERGSLMIRGISSLAYADSRKVQDAACEVRAEHGGRHGGYADEYSRRYGTHLYVVTKGGTDGLTAEGVADIAARFIQNTESPLVVFVDCLQELKEGPAGTDPMGFLEALSAQSGIPVVALDASAQGSNICRPGCTVLAWGWDGLAGRRYRRITVDILDSGDPRHTGTVRLHYYPGHCFFEEAEGQRQ